jgi:hypothetical protein
MCHAATVSAYRRVGTVERGLLVAIVNPFATCFVRPDKNQYRFSLDAASESVDREAFIQNLYSTLRQRRRAAIAGPHGTGKTTLLRSIEPDLQDCFSHVQTLTLSSSRRTSCRELLASWQVNESDANASSCLIVDGYEQLHGWDRVALVRAINRRPHAALIITCHQTPWLFPVCMRTRFDDAMSRMLTEEKLQQVPEPLRFALRDRFEHRMEQSETPRNLRELWFTMYDEFEAIKVKTLEPTKRQIQ